MIIVVLDGHTLNPGDNSWASLEKLGEVIVYPRTPRELIYERGRTADVLLTNKTPINANDIGRLSRLKFISVLATGYNVVDVTAARARGIPVSNVPDYSTESVAQHAMALLLELTNHVGEQVRSVKNGDWSRCPDFCYWEKPVVALHGKSLGIVGMGQIGRRVAQLGHALGMNILSLARPAGDTAMLQIQEGILVERGTWHGSRIPIRRLPAERFFAEADVISLHCPQTEKNLRFVNREILHRMKASAYLINTARGTLINEADLAEALRTGVIAGAALDVLSAEPPETNVPLFGLPNCLVTPHVAWSSLDARQRLMQTTVENILAFQNGHPQNIVNVG